MISRQASWSWKWIQNKSRQGDSLTVIPRNTPMPSHQLLCHEKRTPTSEAMAFNRSTDGQTWIRPIAKHAIRSRILQALSKERPWALTPNRPTLIKNQTNRPDKKVSHALPSWLWDLVTRSEIPWPGHHENWNYMTKGRRRTNNNSIYQNKKYQGAEKAFWRWTSHFQNTPYL